MHLPPSSVTQPKSLLHPLSGLHSNSHPPSLPSSRTPSSDVGRFAFRHDLPEEKEEEEWKLYAYHVQRCTLARAGRQPPGKRGPTDGQGKTIATVNTFLPGACLTHIPTPSTSLCNSMSSECRVNGKRDGTGPGVAANEWLTLSWVAFSTIRRPGRPLKSH